MKEVFFLALANMLPRISSIDRFRLVFYRLAGMDVEGGVLIWSPLVIRPTGGAKNIKCGAGTFINAEVRFGVPVRKVIIGRNVLVGPRVMFETMSHGLVHIPGLGRGAQAREIIVEDEVWIGAGAVITQGVTIGRGAVVAAGAVVTRSVEAYTLVGGVPAKLIRKIEGCGENEG